MPKQILLNIPIILSFNDYHEINYVKNYFNELIADKKIKSKELYSNNYGYSAIFYFKQDEEYKLLVKEHIFISKNKLKPLNGRESSCLALLAQTSTAEKDFDKKVNRVLKSLNGRALKIAKAIIGKYEDAPYDIKSAANSLIEWANGLK